MKSSLKQLVDEQAKIIVKLQRHNAGLRLSIIERCAEIAEKHSHYCNICDNECWDDDLAQSIRALKSKV